MEHRKRLAMWMHGGISGGIFSQGFPKIVQIVNRLSEEFDITVYSLAFVDKNFRPLHFRVYSPPAYVRVKVLRWIYLVMMFLVHHVKVKYEVLQAFWGYPIGFAVVMLGKIIRRPSIVIILGAEAANIPEIRYGHLRGSMSRRLVIWTCNHATRFVAVSEYQVKILKRYGLTRESIVIPWGADKALFYEKLYEGKPPLKILHVSNLTEVKDQKTLLRAFQLIQKKIPVMLRMVGPDFLNGAIQAYARELLIDQYIEFTGAVPYLEIPLHFQWGDVIILTSLSEGQNSSLTEGMMCGLLPVSTAVGMMADKGSEMGIVVNVQDYKALANELIRLYNNPAEWQKRRNVAINWAKEYDFDWTIRQLTHLINNT